MKKIWRKVNKNHGLFALRYILKKRSNSFSLASSKESSHCILCYYSHCFPDLTCRGWSVLHCSYCTHILFQQSFQGCLLATAQPTASAFHLLISVNILTQTVFSLSRLLVEFPSLGEMMICPEAALFLWFLEAGCQMFRNGWCLLTSRRFWTQKMNVTARFGNELVGKGESKSWTNLAAYLISAEKYCESSESQWGLARRGAGLSWQLWAEFPALSRSLPCDLLQIALCHRLAVGLGSPALHFSQAWTVFSVLRTYCSGVQLSLPLQHYWSVFLALRILVS